MSSHPHAPAARSGSEYSLSQLQVWFWLASVCCPNLPGRNLPDLWLQPAGWAEQAPAWPPCYPAWRAAVADRFLPAHGAGLCRRQGQLLLAQDRGEREPARGPAPQPGCVRCAALYPCASASVHVRWRSPTGQLCKAVGFAVRAGGWAGPRAAHQARVRGTANTSCWLWPHALLAGLIHPSTTVAALPGPTCAGGKYVGFGSTPAPRPSGGGAGAGAGAINVDEMTQVGLFSGVGCSGIWQWHATRAARASLQAVYTRCPTLA